LSSVTAKDNTGAERHFFFGGQQLGNEWSGNVKDNYEYIVASDTWVKHTEMPFSRGHTSASSTAFGCGFITAGGSTNEFGKTSDISYYDIPSQTWTSVGSLTEKVNTPICDIYTPPPDTGGTQLYHCVTPFGFLVAAEILPTDADGALSSVVANENTDETEEEECRIMCRLRSRCGFLGRILGRCDK
jgi:hypothetical protein